METQRASEAGGVRPGRVTVFGGSGFVGRRLVARLRSGGSAVRVGSRHPDAATLRDAAGGNGTIEAIEASVLDDAEAAAAVAGADAVVNLVGILAERGRQTFAAVHVDGARRVAAAARAGGATRLVHLSALGAGPASPSAYGRTKAAGERAVREVFPPAIIVRPSVVFGPGDHFFCRFEAIARVSPVLPLIGGGETRFQPVYIEDVAGAIAAMLVRPDAPGKTYELGGPRAYTFRQLMELLLAQTGRRRLFVSLPFPVAEIQGALMQLLPSPPLTRDQVLMLKTDNVPGGHEPGLRELGIEPTAVEDVLPTFLHA